MEKYSLDYRYAIEQDEKDPLRSYRDKFHIPKKANGEEMCYFSGNSLGAQPKKAIDFVMEEMEKWKLLGAGGHRHEKAPWTTYPQLLTEKMAHLIGAKLEEVVLMNGLTVNLHLMLVSFYKPTSSRYKILINPYMFSSDYYALCSELRFHGFDPEEAILELPVTEDGIVDENSIGSIFDQHGHEIALVFMEGVNYLTGQAFDLGKVAEIARRHGCVMGCDLAHGVGNCEYALHEIGMDFAVWCTYKYLNGGPGCIGGCFIHKKHHNEKELPRFEGWWGHDIRNRFICDPNQKPMSGADGWQLSNPPILTLACLRASLEIFEEVGMKRLRAKSKNLTGYLEFLLMHLSKKGVQITPKDPQARGCQLSIRIPDAEAFANRLKAAGFSCDFRLPDVVRLAPVPLYNTFQDLFKLYKFLKE